MKDRRAVEEKVFSYMERHGMLEAGDRVVLGVSGGADSVCLLFVLLEYARRVPVALSVVHINHGIRAEAGEDACFVEELCGREGLPFTLVREDVRARAVQWRCSEEEAGRQVRYEAFDRAARDFGGNKIAVAHNCNDRGETMLFHLFRGSGLRGLSGIPPVRGRIIRPLLCLERPLIEAYLGERGIPFRRDATNDQDDYTRNRIRRHILPYAEREIAPGCVASMARTAELLSEDEDYLEGQTKVAAESCAEKESSGFRVSLRSFRELHPALQKRTLHMLVKELSPGQRDISYVHIGDLLTLFEREGNREICLPFGIRGRREYEWVVLERSVPETECLPKERGAETALPWEELVPGACILTEGFFGRARISLFEKKEINSKDIPQNECTKWFDCDRIKKSLVLRTRQSGDYLTIAAGDGGLAHKSLKDYMIARKIPRQERDRIPVLAEGNHILWLAGYRISEYYKITGNTKRILQVQLSMASDNR